MNNGFNTIEEALEELRKGRIILLRMTPTERTRAISSALRNMPRRKMSTSWHPTPRDLYACP